MVALNDILNNLFYQLNQEGIFFLLVSAVAFAFTYVSLRGFFLKKSAATVATQLGIGKQSEYVENQPMLVVISVCIGLLVGAGVSRSEWVFYFAGSTLGIQSGLEWIVSSLGFIFPMVIVGAFLFMLFKPISKSIGKVWATEISIIVVWAILKYFVSYSDIMFYLPFGVQDFFMYATHPGIFVIALIVGGIVAKITK